MSDLEHIMSLMRKYTFNDEVESELGEQDAAAGAATAAGATGALVAGAAAAGLAAGVTSLLCDQALLVGIVMSADSNKIREMFMADSLKCID